MKRGEFNKTFPFHFDFGASLRKPYGESSFARLVRQYKTNAKRRGLLFELSNEEFRKPVSSCCFYCGTKPQQIMTDKSSNGEYIYNGIDRKNKDYGYLPGNCVPACKVCNKAKTNMEESEWIEWINRIVIYNNDGHKGGIKNGRNENDISRRCRRICENGWRPLSVL